MKLQIAVIMLFLIVFSVALIATGDDKPLERLGNEAAVLGDTLYAEEKYIEAAEKWEEAYNYFIRAQVEDEIPFLEEKIAHMLRNMSTAYIQGEDFENAVRVNKIRLQEEPTNAEHTIRIATIYQRHLNDLDKAAEILIEFDNNNNSFNIRERIARLKVNKEDYQAALNWYQKAFEMRQNPEILQNIAVLHQRLGNVQDAINAYESFIETNPRESVLVGVYTNMGKFYDDIGNQDKSIEYYELANRLRFNRGITTHLLVNYIDKGDFMNAREKANQLLQDNPQSPEGVYYTGLILFEQERYSEAKEYFRRITENRTFGSGARQYIEFIDSL